ncbi:RING/FYVE/PHD zinc finger superfamily protein [Zea mays]|uniref:RING/FYVE/PHD zinc finger superfamily protein n=1 Tax=Zea mays TaxID=4577 RepID=K7V544_MAIZE|nr:RING/FYVE/PHD zinc finger superfamily protein [Zea mays]AQK97953.1 RING/FYVE/PHD zinc finger superfamily protein [Zea mays]
MRRDAVAAAPTAAGASPPIPATVLPTDAVVIDVEGEPLPAEAPGLGCRICHLGPEDDESAVPGSEVMLLGCGCKDELGAAHQQCAEAWFRIKGDSCHAGAVKYVVQMPKTSPGWK